MWKLLLGIWLLSVTGPVRAQAPAHTFALADEQFVLDGRPFQMISGEMHYPRVPRKAWRQRMRMAKAMGLNTIGTYVFWNLHEPAPGKFDFAGNNDIAAFVQTAQQEGLWVVLRPSPYVCAEWEFGGYPYWLQQETGLRVRSKDPKFVAAYRRYIRAVGRQLAPLQVNHGGPVLMVQLENEYGSYGNDQDYLKLNQQLFREAGFDGLLYTCDPAKDVVNGHLPGLLPAVNGLDKPGQVKQLVRQYHGGKGPYFIAEWYPAWFDWWGTPHHTVPAATYAARLDSVLGAGISINMYMFHGGTTRGFLNGANYKGPGKPYEPQTSSYDYDAPLDEAGNATAKFRAFRQVIEKHLPAGTTLPPVPAAKPTMQLPPIPLTTGRRLTTQLPKPRVSARPLTFEDLNQAYGFVLYRTQLQGGRTGTLRIKELRDYAVVLVNGQRAAVLDRRLSQDSVALTLPAGTVTLDILVENLGRINFGPYLNDNRKGITRHVTFGGQELTGWQHFSLPFDDITKAAATLKGPPASSETGPVLRSGSFTVATPADTYLDMSRWGKGCVWLNGHHLGRYWEVGPQQTLYVPAEWLRKGRNEVVVLELLKPGQTELRTVNQPILSVVKSAAGAQP
ncbi:glycoside hydrolase family 35 protein [Hymenobacter chitinivorans]|uniref:Beta-galactosidase n=1 Tax=Hymenobacter chitinivorans DSM 11115 TaxID=1121954 RepID=A0A2M9B5B0_9BACT|nr:beta-galactosidase family protein [Hymenobacter chitinivorans]PJJ53133.1 beta-galactosidase [Hymenobacter chitinivorans DSM 11115]